MILELAIASHTFEDVPLKMLEGLSLQSSQKRDVLAVSFDVPRRRLCVATNDCVGLVGVDLYEVLVNILDGVGNALGIGFDRPCHESFR